MTLCTLHSTAASAKLQFYCAERGRRCSRFYFSTHFERECFALSVLRRSVKPFKKLLTTYVVFDGPRVQCHLKQTLCFVLFLVVLYFFGGWWDVEVF